MVSILPIRNGSLIFRVPPSLNIPILRDQPLTLDCLSSALALSLLSALCNLLSIPISVCFSTCAQVPEMVSATVARNIVGIIGNVISFGLFLSPVPTFYKIFKNKAVEEFKPDPYIATVLNCMFWILYGLPCVHPDSLLVVTINSVGLAFELVYLAIFFFYTDIRGRKKVSLCLLVEVIFVAAIALITMLALHGTKNRSLMVGIICDVFNIMMYVSPLTIMRKVIKTKSVKYMPFTLSLTNFLNGCIWTAYALIKFDLFVLISNGIGAVSGFIQLVLYAYYYLMGSEVEDDADKKPSESQLSTANGAYRV